MGGGRAKYAPPPAQRKAETGLGSDYCKNYGNLRLRRSESQSRKQEEAT
jgi:hypothetical protein